MEFDPHSDRLRRPPLPRSTGERKHRPQGSAPFLYPTKVGERWPRSGRSGGRTPYAIALPSSVPALARRSTFSRKRGERGEAEPLGEPGEGASAEDERERRRPSFVMFGLPVYDEG